MNISEADVKKQYGYTPVEKISPVEQFKTRLQCNASCMKNIVKLILPILNWLPSYPIVKYLFGDVISGITTAAVRIPQGLAYGLLAGLFPINGLYTGFFAPLIYAIFGTSRHISVGTFAVISMMLGSVIDNLNVDVQLHFGSVIANTSNNISELTESEIIGYTDEQRLTIITSLTVLVGIIMIFLSLCRLGIIAVFLSEPVVSAFTTAAAIYVLTSQLKHITGIPLHRRSGIFALIQTYVELFRKISEIQWSAVIISIICLVILVPVKYVNRTYKQKLKNIPIPIELVVVIVGTIASYYGKFNDNYEVNIVGPVPKGMPSPILPRVSLWPHLIGDAISIAVVVFAISVSMGKIFAKKHDYTIDSNQEFFALGMCQLFAGFFQGHAACGALARSSVQESSGGNTQMASFVSCIVLLLVLLVVGPVLKSLPIACFTQSPTFANKSALQNLASQMVDINNPSGNVVNIAPDDDSDEQTPIIPIQYIIFDCPSWSYIDSVGMSTLKQVVKELSEANFQVYFSSLCEEVQIKLKSCGIINCESSLAKVYPSLYHATVAAKAQIEQ